MSPTPGRATEEPTTEALDRRTRALIRLAALLVLGAPTTSVQWAVELASATGADVETLTGVLLAAAPAAGTAQVCESAPRLALALGFDLELD
jgi:4-carboxymuconolactone decarboxylase